MNRSPRSARWRRTMSVWCGAMAAVSAAAFAVNLIAIAGGVTAPAADAAGTLAGQLEIRDTGVMPLASGGSATLFTLVVPQGAATPQCPGDTATDGWRISSYMIPASISPAGLTFGNTGPIPLTFGADLRIPLFTSGPFVGRNLATTPAGLYVDAPQFSFQARTPGQILPGTYNLGLACINGPAGPNQMNSYWNTQMTFVASGSDPAGVTWCAGASCSSGATTTTAASTTTTTTVAGATTTTSTTVAGATTTTSTTVAGATTTTAAGATTTTVPGTKTVAVTGGTATLSASGGTIGTFTNAAASPAAPAGVTFPFGQFAFTSTSATNGIVTFTLTLPIPATSYYKLINNAWTNFTFDGETGAQFSGNTITIKIKDNGRGDSNATAGQISDPGAPAVSSSAVTTTTAPSTGGITGGGGVTTLPGLVATGGSSTMLMVWGVMLLIFGRMAILFGRPIRVRTDG